MFVLLLFGILDVACRADERGEGWAHCDAKEADDTKEHEASVGLVSLFRHVAHRLPSSCARG